MAIVQITEQEFDEFAKSSPYKNFYQTVEYGMLMDRHNFDDYYLALKDSTNTIIAATLILVNKVFIGYKWGYCPRGFLIDFHNNELVREFTDGLKEYLKMRNFMFVKLDPYVIYKSRQNNGEIINGIDNTQVIENLKSLGYEHTGFNLYFENMKPRWNAVITTDETDTLFFKYSKEIRNKIRKAEKRGIEIVKGNPENIKEFYSLVSKRNTRKLNYYLDMYEIMGKKDMVEIYFANINTAKYVKESKELFEKEERNNNLINEELEENINSNNTSNIIKRKMQSDSLLNVYKQNIINATNLYKEYPSGIIIGACLIIKYNNEIFFLIDGFKDDYKNYCPNHYMKFQIIEKYRHEGYKRFHLNGITGNFEKTSQYYGLNKFKLGFNANIEEYIGEFNLIINRAKYKTYVKIKPIKEWLDTPVFK